MTTAYMVSFFAGGVLGSMLSATVYAAAARTRRARSARASPSWRSSSPAAPAVRRPSAPAGHERTVGK